MNHLYVFFTKAVEKAKKVRYHFFAVTFLLLPFLAPTYGIGDLIEKWVGYAAIVVGGLILWVGAKALLEPGGLWSKLGSIIALVFSAGLLVEGALRVFLGNSLGSVFYNLFVSELSSP